MVYFDNNFLIALYNVEHDRDSEARQRAGLE